MDEQQFRIMIQRMKEDPNAVIAELGPASAAQPSDHHVWFILGCALLKVNDLDGAAKCLARAVNLSPDDAGYIYYSELASHRLGNIKAANAAFANVHRLDPNVVPKNFRPPPVAVGREAESAG